MLTVVVRPQVARPLLPTDAVALREVQPVLERCITADRDILLPGSTRRQQSTIFFIVACVAQEAAEVLRQRIQRQLAGCEAFHKAGLEAVVSWNKIDQSAQEPSASCPPRMADIVPGIEAMMEAAFRQERN